MTLLLAVGMLAMAAPTANAAGQAPALGAAANFAVLAGTAVTCTGGTITGNVGVFPGTAITQTGCPVTGTLNAADAAAGPAHGDFVIAYNELATRTCDQTLTGLGSLTLAPGVYCFDAAATQTGGVLTLDGPSDGTWIFKIGTLGTGALTGTGFSVVMGGGQASNVYWHVAQATTMTDSNFLGTILGGAGITMTRGTFGGRALANAAVTITGTAVSGFAAATPTPTPTPPGATADPRLLALITDDDVFSTADLSVLLAPLAPLAPLALLAPTATNGNGTQHYGPFASGSPDSGTCGNDWAQDTFDRHFTVRQTGPTSYEIVEQFKKGAFVTVAGASPGACQTTDGSSTQTVAAGITGTMHGYLILLVTGTQTSTDPSCTTSGPCNGDTFVGSHFAGTITDVPTFFFHYAGKDGSNQVLIEHEWKNASNDRGGNHGDIATQ